VSEDLYAAERENLIESDPIALVDELLELRRKLAETEYEYNIERTSGVTGRTTLCYGKSDWDDDLALTQEDFNGFLLSETSVKFGATYRLVKRRKAGEIEYVA
jgi:hypothetical protein